MNKALAVTAVGVLAAGATFAAYKTGAIGPQYADVLSANPITIKQDVYADVLNTTPVTRVVNGTREVCENKQVERRRAERFGNKDGAVIGAVVGGLIGNQIGGGDGRKLATVAGAVGGGYAGREIDRRHTGGKRYTETQRICRTEDTSNLKTIGYDVQYRMEDGQVLTRRESEKPGDRIWMGQKDVVTGYDVTWRYREKVGSLRMGEKPGQQLPIKNGVIVVDYQDNQTAKR